MKSRIGPVILPKFVDAYGAHSTMPMDSTLNSELKPPIVAPSLPATSTSLSNGMTSTESSAQIREAYARTKQELIEALAKKRNLDRQLIQCEVQLYEAEAQYLAETSTGSGGGGNIIQGFDGYLKNTGLSKRRTEISDADRMFSNSSSTYAKVCVPFHKNNKLPSLS